MMKEKYSDIRFAWKKALTNDEFLVYMDDVLSGASNLPFASRQNYQMVKETLNDDLTSSFTVMPSGNINAFILDYMLIKNDPFMTHYFIETKELFDFLVGMEIRETSFLHEMSKNWDANINNHFVAKGDKLKMVVLHHQYASLPSIKVIVHMKNSGKPEEMAYLYVEDGDSFAGFLEKDIETSEGKPSDTGFLIKNLNDKDKWNLPMYRYGRLAMNFFMYGKCFPDCIVEGVPEMISNPNHYRRMPNKIRLTVSKDILFRGKSAIKPHFRSGYFKCLMDERFTRKKGQVIFVSSTFVKGKAKTVEENRA